MNKREEFEAWFNRNYAPHNMEFLHLVNSYTSNKVNAFWEAWQAALASQAQQESVSQWISVEEELPAYGQIVDLSINGVLQNETYEIDATDNDLYLTHFWTRDGLDGGLNIKQGQFWRARLPMPKPLPPEPEGK